MKNKISIITAVYNGEKLLPRLIDSITKQTCNDFEFIVIDGNSKDQTVSIIKKNEGVINYWISEPDKGIYDAWNKGIDKASGDWIMFLGCDDVLLPDALNEYYTFIKTLDNKSEIEFISSREETINKNGKTIRTRGWSYEWPVFVKEMTIVHAGALHSKKLFEKYGKFDINYKIVGDFELLLRAGSNLKYAFMNEITIKSMEGGASDSVASIKEHYKAATTTGKHPFYKAFINASITYVKFQTRKMFKEVGINLYLKK
jgi:glycosyltransferase involved in cell wall biosynthesis